MPEERKTIREEDNPDAAQPIEPQIIEPQRAVARPPQPTTINDLAQREDGLAVIERAVQALTSLRRASIALTAPHDWTLYRAEDKLSGIDRVTGYLESLACWNIRGLWGVSTVDLDKPYKIEHETGAFAWAIEGGGYCSRTDVIIDQVIGICYSDEDFLINRKLGPLKFEEQMKITARQRLEGILVREASGLKRVPIEELDDVWKGTWKSSRMCPKGRGFGSVAERQGAAVQQSEIPIELQPRCEQCNGAMKFIPAGTSQSGKPYGAFWSCPAKDHKYTLRHEQALAEAKRAKDQTQRQPGEET